MRRALLGVFLLSACGDSGGDSETDIVTGADITGDIFEINTISSPDPPFPTNEVTTDNTTPGVITSESAVSSATTAGCGSLDDLCGDGNPCCPGFFCVDFEDYGLCFPEDESQDEGPFPETGGPFPGTGTTF